MDYDGPTTEPARDGGTSPMPPNQGCDPEWALRDKQHAIQREASLKGSGVNRLSLDSVVAQSASVFDRVLMECDKGERNAHRYNRALRARHLIERYPEVAELVELLRHF